MKQHFINSIFFRLKIQSHSKKLECVDLRWWNSWRHNLYPCHPRPHKSMKVINRRINFTFDVRCELYLTINETPHLAWFAIKAYMLSKNKVNVNHNWWFLDHTSLCNNIWISVFIDSPNQLMKVSYYRYVKLNNKILRFWTEFIFNTLNSF